MEWKQKYYEELYHHGIKGQKWGIRRYQNPDGSLTPAGKARERAHINRVINTSNSKLVKLLGGYSNDRDGVSQRSIHKQMYEDWYENHNRQYLNMKNRGFSAKDLKKYKDDVFEKYAEKRVDAWIRDNDPNREYSAEGRAYILEYLKRFD